ncbi:MAG: mechanosensitive ion channel [Planctomycetes bacterium]|nr:mechanosensitive ion channel [Planctomycetota bacterium]
MANGTHSYARASLLPSVFRVLQAGVILWLVTGLLFGTALLLNITGPLIRSVEYGLAVFSVYVLFQGFLSEAVGERGWGRPLMALPSALARHSYMTFHVILLYTAILITLRGVLTSFDATGEMLWRVYEISILALFIWFVAPKHLFMELLSPAETKTRKFLRGCVHFVHPVTIALLVFLVVLNAMGYIAMSYALINTLIGSIITVVSVAAVRKLITALIVDRLARKRRAMGQEVDFRATRNIIDFTSVIISIIVITSLWVETYVDVSAEQTAPASLRAVVTNMALVLKRIYSVLIFKLSMGGEAHTTPLNIIIAIITVIIFFFVATLIKKLIDRKLIKKLNVEEGMSATISAIATYVIVAFSILFALSIAGIPLRSLAFFAGALGVGIGFGMQNIVNNFLSGIILMFERPIKVGDFLILGAEERGTVVRIGPRSTTLQSPERILIVVPNAKLMGSSIQNQSQPTNKVRGKLKVGVAYGCDVQLVEKLLKQVAAENPRVNKKPEPFVRFNEFGDSCYDFELIFWASSGGERWYGMSEMNFAIEKLFAEHGIEIPFPQRDLNIRSIPPETEDMLPDSKKATAEKKKKETKEKGAKGKDKKP